MSDENKKTPNTDGKSTNFEKGVKIDLNENKIPDFKFTPPPPPPTTEPTKTDTTSTDTDK